WPVDLPGALCARLAARSRAAAGLDARRPASPARAHARDPHGADRAARIAARAGVCRLARELASGGLVCAQPNAGRGLRRVLPARRPDAVSVLPGHQRRGAHADPAAGAVGSRAPVRRAVRVALAQPAVTAAVALPARVAGLEPRRPGRRTACLAGQPRALPPAQGRAASRVCPLAPYRLRLLRRDRRGTVLPLSAPLRDAA